MSKHKDGQCGVAALSIGEWVPIDKLVPWAKNPRKNDVAARHLAEKIRRFGFVAPAVVWPARDMLVAGHARLKAMHLLLADDPAFTPRGAPGPGMVPVRFYDFKDEREAEEYALADNKLNDVAEWDALALFDLKTDEGFKLEELGWSLDELTDLSDVADGKATASFAAMDGRAATAPRKTMVSVLVACDDAETVERAIESALGDECKTRGQALQAICTAWLGAK